MTQYAVHVKTQEEYDKLIEALEKKGGYYWRHNKDVPLRDANVWSMKDSGRELYVSLLENDLSWDDESWFQDNGYTILDLKSALNHLGVMRSDKVEKGNLGVGDVIVNDFGRKFKVLAICDEVVALSDSELSDNLLGWYSFTHLGKNDKIYLPPSEAPVKEMSVAEISKALGYEVKVVKE